MALPSSLSCLSVFSSKDGNSFSVSTPSFSFPTSAVFFSSSSSSSSSIDTFAVSSSSSSSSSLTSVRAKVFLDNYVRRKNLGVLPKALNFHGSNSSSLVNSTLLQIRAIYQSPESFLQRQEECPSQFYETPSSSSLSFSSSLSSSFSVSSSSFLSSSPSSSVSSSSAGRQSESALFVSSAISSPSAASSLISQSSVISSVVGVDSSTSCLLPSSSSFHSSISSSPSSALRSSSSSFPCTFSSPSSHLIQSHPYTSVATNQPFSSQLTFSTSVDTSHLSPSLSASGDDCLINSLKTNVSSSSASPPSTSLSTPPFITISSDSSSASVEEDCSTASLRDIVVEQQIVIEQLRNEMEARNAECEHHRKSSEDLRRRHERLLLLLERPRVIEEGGGGKIRREGRGKEKKTMMIRLLPGRKGSDSKGREEGEARKGEDVKERRGRKICESKEKNEEEDLVDWKGGGGGVIEDGKKSDEAEEEVLSDDDDICREENDEEKKRRMRRRERRQQLSFLRGRTSKKNSKFVCEEEEEIASSSFLPPSLISSEKGTSSFSSSSSSSSSSPSLSVEAMNAKLALYRNQILLLVRENQMTREAYNRQMCSSSYIAASSKEGGNAMYSVVQPQFHQPSLMTSTPPSLSSAFPLPFCRGQTKSFSSPYESRATTSSQAEENGASAAIHESLYVPSTNHPNIIMDRNNIHNYNNINNSSDSSSSHYRYYYNQQHLPTSSTVYIPNVPPPLSDSSRISYASEFLSSPPPFPQPFEFLPSNLSSS